MRRLRLLATIVAATGLLAASIGSASAANPSASVVLTVCSDGSDVVVTLNWSATPAKSWGISTNLGSLGFTLDRVTRAGTSSITFNDGPTSVEGFLGLGPRTVAHVGPITDWGDCQVG